jgi:hypothetical protein
MLSVAFHYCYAELRCTKCHYAECRHGECRDAKRTVLILTLQAVFCKVNIGTAVKVTHMPVVIIAVSAHIQILL